MGQAADADAPSQLQYLSGGKGWRKKRRTFFGETRREEDGSCLEQTRELLSVYIYLLDVKPERSRCAVSNA